MRERQNCYIKIGNDAGWLKLRWLKAVPRFFSSSGSQIGRGLLKQIRFQDSQPPGLRGDSPGLFDSCWSGSHTELTDGDRLPRNYSQPLPPQMYLAKIRGRYCPFGRLLSAGAKVLVDAEMSKAMFVERR